jgi:hypothetical protein
LLEEGSQGGDRVTLQRRSQRGLNGREFIFILCLKKLEKDALKGSSLSQIREWESPKRSGRAFNH